MTVYKGNLHYINNPKTIFLSPQCLINGATFCAFCLFWGYERLIFCHNGQFSDDLVLRPVLAVELPVLPGGHARKLLEGLAEVALGGESQGIGNFLIGSAAVCKLVPGVHDLFL